MGLGRTAVFLAVFAALLAGTGVLLREKDFDFDENAYDLVPAVAPRLAGTMLTVFATIVRLPIIGSFLAQLLYVENHFHKLRKFVALHPEVPTYYPLVIPTADELQAHAALAAQPQTLFPPRAAIGADGFRYWAAQDFVDAYLSGTTTPTQVAERLIAAVEASASLNIIVHLNASDLRAQARAATARYAAKASLGPLDGVPVAVKEEMPVAGYRTTLGTAFLGAGPELADAVAIARLRAAGALVVGGANMHELGIGTTGHNIHYGPARNPHAPAHHTGGSSSGSAAAVAAGLAPIAIGADGGGSIRLPSALCGVSGLKATFARVPAAAKMAWSVGHVGPIATSARDLALAYTVIAGPDATDPASTHQPPVHAAAPANPSDLTGLRVGVYWAWANDSVPEVRDRFSATIAALQARGAQIVPVTFPYLDVFAKALALTITAEMATFTDHQFETGVRTMAGDSQLILTIARVFSARDFLAAQEVRTRALKEFRRVFASVDVLATPTTPVPAPAIALDGLLTGESNITLTTTIMRYMFLGNLAGVPALSVPMGYDRSGLPLAFQAMAPHWHEHRLLHVAAAVESFTALKRPAHFFDLLSGPPAP
eukprot:m.142815 g.142815  ORF g.142815 m.142815 type:complete len:600 (+) comp14977_c6_seq1:363-2162(+)